MGVNAFLNDVSAGFLLSFEVPNVLRQQARVGIQHHGQIDEFLGQPDVGDVSHPKLISRCWHKVPRQVRIHGEAMFGIRRDMEILLAKTQQIVFAQNSAHPFVVYLEALALQLSANARPAISCWEP